jgi:2-keto-3-deoxy-L-rhamnonate aldolase RhmA
MRNPFKRAICKAETQIGMWVGLADGFAAELLATIVFDSLLIDGERAPKDPRGRSPNSSQSHPMAHTRSCARWRAARRSSGSTWI